MSDTFYESGGVYNVDSNYNGQDLKDEKLRKLLSRHIHLLLYTYDMRKHHKIKKEHVKTVYKKDGHVKHRDTYREKKEIKEFA